MAPSLRRYINSSVIRHHRRNISLPSSQPTTKKTIRLINVTNAKDLKLNEGALKSVQRDNDNRMARLLTKGPFTAEWYIQNRRADFTTARNVAPSQKSIYSRHSILLSSESKQQTKFLNEERVKHFNDGQRKRTGDDAPTHRDHQFSVNAFVEKRLAISGDQRAPTKVVISNLIKLLRRGVKVASIMRYQAHQLDGLPVDQVRKAYMLFNKARILESEMKSVMRRIEKQGTKMTPRLVSTINEATSVQQLEDIAASFNRNTLMLERAKEVGLDAVALSIILTGATPDLNAFIEQQGQQSKGLETIEDVKDCVKTILANHFVESTVTQTKIQQFMEYTGYELECSWAQKPQDISPAYRKKYGLLSQLKMFLEDIGPNQILTINRAERLRLLKAQINVPKWVGVEYVRFVRAEFGIKVVTPQMIQIFESAVQDSYTRLVQLQITKSLRLSPIFMLSSALMAFNFDGPFQPCPYTANAKLTKKGEQGSLEAFRSKFRQILLYPPLRSERPLLGIDPGFEHGCKMAIIAPNNDVISTGVFYLPPPSYDPKKPDAKQDNRMAPLKELILRHGCEHVGIGDGDGCERVTYLLRQLIQDGAFKPLNVQYKIVGEQGSSHYSVSKLAEEELPDVPLILRSAVSIARRLQDPMSEMVKMEPKHISAGMYQHDLEDKLLNDCRDSVVKECVKAVGGVNLETCSLQLLKYATGLNETTARNILSERQRTMMKGGFGGFTALNELLKVKGIISKSMVEQTRHHFIIRITDKPPLTTNPVMPPAKKVSLEEDQDDASQAPSTRDAGIQAADIAASPSGTINASRSPATFHHLNAAAADCAVLSPSLKTSHQMKTNSFVVPELCPDTLTLLKKLEVACE